MCTPCIHHAGQVPCPWLFWGADARWLPPLGHPLPSSSLQLSSDNNQPFGQLRQHNSDLDSLLSNIMSPSFQFWGGSQSEGGQGGVAQAARLHRRQVLARKRTREFLSEGGSQRVNPGGRGVEKMCRACGHSMKGCKAKHHTVDGCLFDCVRCGKRADVIHNNSGCIPPHSAAEEDDE